MMKIISPGNVHMHDEPKRFQCANCWCIFEANSSEYDIVKDELGTYTHVQCPWCSEHYYQVVKDE